VNRFVVFFVISAVFNTVVCAQTESAPNRQNPQPLLDSLNGLANTRWNTDSLTILSWSDSLKQSISGKFASDSLGIRHKIDSLERLQLPTEKYTRKLDSLTNKKAELLTEVNSKQDQLLAKTKGKLEQWQDKVKSKLGLDSLALHSGLSTPNANVPGMPGNTTIPNLGGDLELPVLPALSAGDFQGADLSPDLSKFNESLSFGDLDGLNDIQGKLGELGDVGDKLSEVTALTKDTDKAIESALGNVDEVKGVQDQLKQVDGVQQSELVEKAKQLQDPDAMKEELKQQVQQQVQQQAVNHFAGKEEQLKQAMEKIAKYKQKYSSINSLSEIPKKRPNEMKGKPLVERLLPGIALQIQRKNDLLVDFNPYVGYRFTGRLTAGLGWNQRYAYNTGDHSFNARSRIFGPRAYGEFKVWKGFAPRAEVELMNTFVPPLGNPPVTDAGKREWVWSAMVGLKKDYRFIKRVRGTAMIMFNLFNRHHKSPYVDVVNMRFGFEFPMKKKRK
jgi:hypothetical protein